MKELYSKIYHNLQKIDFESIWHGFSPCEFALYDEHKVYFFDRTQPVDNRFLGNTSIFYDGKPLAIWKVTNPMLQDPILLTAKIVHEMFHSFQKEQHEERFPDDLMMLSYPDDAVIHTIRQEENKLLASIFLESDTSKRKRFSKALSSCENIGQRKRPISSSKSFCQKQLKEWQNMPAVWL